MNRETKKIKTESGVLIEFYSYITGKEMRDIQNVFLKDAEFSVKAKGKPAMNSIKASLMNEAQDKTFETMIISVNDKKENVVKEIGNLPLKDFDEIVKALNEITNIKKDESDTLED